MLLGGLLSSSIGGMAAAAVGPPKSLPDQMLKPEGLIFGATQGASGLSLRYGALPAPANARAAVLVLHGYSSHIERGYETFRSLHDMGLAVFTMDLPGQGGSERFLNNAYKGHVPDFAVYTNDVAHIIDTVVRPQIGDLPLVIMGTSLGGQVALRFASENNTNLAALIMDVPMLDVYTDPWPFWLASFIVNGMKFVGMGSLYAPGKDDWMPNTDTTRTSPVSSDPERVKLTAYWHNEKPALRMGGQTASWVAAAFESMETLKDEAILSQISAPTLILSAGQDRIVVSDQHALTCDAMPACTLYFDAASKHGFMEERDDIRNRALEKMRVFLDEVLP